MGPNLISPSQESIWLGPSCAPQSQGVKQKDRRALIVDPIFVDSMMVTRCAAAAAKKSAASKMICFCRADHPERSLSGTEIGTQGLEFHSYLGREKPLLLEFKYAGNRWQQVKVWLREAERISSSPQTTVSHRG
jgi:hypothetical protein